MTPRTLQQKLSEDNLCKIDAYDTAYRIVRDKQETEGYDKLTSAEQSIWMRRLGLYTLPERT